MSGDGDTGVARVRGPDDAEDVGRDSGHAEAEKEAGQDELVRATFVKLEDGHVEDGAANEEGQQHAGDGIIDGDGWAATEAGVCGEVGRALQRDG